MLNARTFTGSAEINAMVARVAPAILELLADGTPRSKAAIVEALAGRHDRQDVIGTLIRLSVIGEVEEAGGKYMLAAAEVWLTELRSARGRREDDGDEPSRGHLAPDIRLGQHRRIWSPLGIPRPLGRGSFIAETVAYRPLTITPPFRQFLAERPRPERQPVRPRHSPG